MQRSVSDTRRSVADPTVLVEQGQRAGHRAASPPQPTGCADRRRHEAVWPRCDAVLRLPPHPTLARAPPGRPRRRLSACVRARPLAVPPVRRTAAVSNETTRANLQAAEPVPVDHVMSPDRPPDDATSGAGSRPRAATTPTTSSSCCIAPATGAPGVDVSPLVTESGAASSSTAAGCRRAATATPRPTYRRRRPALSPSRAGSASMPTAPATGCNRRRVCAPISSAAIDPTLPYDRSTTASSTSARSSQRSGPSPELADPPDLGAGPRFFYGLQWWFFGLLALGFFVYFACAEYGQVNHQRLLRGPAGSQLGSQRAGVTSVDRHHRPGQVPGGRGEQEGRDPAELLRPP